MNNNENLISKEFLEKEVNKKVISLWKEYYEKTKDDNLLNPNQLVHELKKNSLLIIGCNPSFVKGWVLEVIEKYEEIIKEIDTTEIDKMNFTKYYKFLNYEKYRVLHEKINFDYSNRKQWWDENKRFMKLKEVLNIDIEYIDLFYLSETNQRLIKNLNKIDPEFLERQFKISFDIINELKPKIILVVNAFSSKYLCEKLSLSNNFDNDIGTYLFEMGTKRIPIFLSGMLYGQHSLDDGSFERLAWHMKFVYDKYYSYE